MVASLILVSIAASEVLNRHTDRQNCALYIRLITYVMVGTSLYIVFLGYISSSLAQTCSSQLPKVYLGPIFWKNQTYEDSAKMKLMEKCLSNLEDCAKGIPLVNITEEISTTQPTGMINTCNLLKCLLFNTVITI